MGKTIMGNFVVNDIGECPSLTKRIARNIARLIPLEPLSLLFGWRAWHDRIPDIYVVKAENPGVG